MARPEKRTARKDYPQQGIVKGDEYWFVQIKTGPRSSRVLRQKHPFKRSQLTQSDYLSQLYDWEDALTEIDSMESAQQFADDIRTLGEEQREKFDNMPEGLQQGDSGQILEARADACEAAADEIETIVNEWDSARGSWEEDIEQYKADLAAHEADPDNNPEPTLPDNTNDAGDEFEFDETDFIDQVAGISVDA